jgi:hypothetical protein
MFLMGRPSAEPGGSSCSTAPASTESFTEQNSGTIACGPYELTVDTRGRGGRMPGDSKSVSASSAISTYLKGGRERGCVMSIARLDEV